MENVFLTPDSPSSPPEGFSKVQIFQKIVHSLRKHFFRHPGQNNRLFEENILLTPEVCSFDSGGRHRSLDPFDSIEPSTSTKIEISMFCVGKVFLTLRTHKQANIFFTQDAFQRETEQFQKTNTRFEFLDPDYPSVNPYEKCGQTMFF